MKLTKHTKHTTRVIQEKSLKYRFKYYAVGMEKITLSFTDQEKESECYFIDLSKSDVLNMLHEMEKMESFLKGESK